jgi:hypothetical protein
MTLAHIHLVACHFPIVGTLVALPILAYAWLRLDRSAYLSAASVLVIAGVAAAVTVGTGDAAEELVEHQPGVAAAAIEAHEEAAEWAAGLTIANALVATAVLALAARRRALPAFGVAAALVGTIASAGAAARAGSLGGAIRHTELASAAAVGVVDVEDDDE